MPATTAVSRPPAGPVAARQVNEGRLAARQRGRGTCRLLGDFEEIDREEQPPGRLTPALELRDTERFGRLEPRGGPTVGQL